MMMDFNLKQWRDESEDQHQTSEKLPTLLLNSSTAPLPLFTTATATATENSSSDNMSSSTTSARMGSYFSLGQWQELELQALIYRHMIAGAAVPPELLHLVKKSIISSSSSSPYYICNPLHQYYPHYQPTMVQSGYWGRAAMDPEPGRCRRTDGKKWRCSRDVVAGQKYCERHMHRGRNRSRKPVEIPTSTANTYGGGSSGGGGPLRTNHSTTQGMGAAVDGGGTTAHFSLSGPSPSMDLLHLNHRPMESITETKYPYESQNDGQNNGGQTLRRFFDDWPRSLHDTDNGVSSATNLSISMPSSDVSLKLGTGNGDEFNTQGTTSDERVSRPQMNWGATWENTRAGPMGGPLAEALRSSTSTSSPTSVLQRMVRSSVSEASYVSS